VLRRVKPRHHLMAYSLRWSRPARRWPSRQDPVTDANAAGSGRDHRRLPAGQDRAIGLIRGGAEQRSERAGSAVIGQAPRAVRLQLPQAVQQPQFTGCPPVMRCRHLAHRQPCEASRMRGAAALHQVLIPSSSIRPTAAGREGSSTPGK